MLPPHKSVGVCLFVSDCVVVASHFFLLRKKIMVTGNAFTVSSYDSLDPSDESCLQLFWTFSSVFCDSDDGRTTGFLFNSPFTFVWPFLFIGSYLIGFHLFWPFSNFFFVRVCMAEFACVSLHHLIFCFCSPVTLINFWPVDSAWVLALKGAASTNTFACLIFKKFCSVCF